MNPFAFFSIYLDKSPPIPPPPPTPALVGTVFDAATGNPLPDVTITVQDRILTTPADGKFAIAGVVVPTRVDASLTDYQPVTIEVTTLESVYNVYMQKLPPPPPPAPPPSVDPIFLYSTIGLAVAAGALGVIWMRSTSGKEYFHRQVTEEAKKLDVMLIRLNRTDKSLAGEVSQVKESLERISQRKR